MKISVIIPTYNRASIIARSIQSVIDQCYPAHEIIVVDDCGNDDTEQVVASFNDNRIKYIKLSENKGQSYARNYGSSIATGSWIAFQDSDTIWHTDKLQKQVEYINDNPECQFVYSSYIREDKGLTIPTCFNLDSYSGDMLTTLLLRNTVDAPSILISKVLFDEVGGFDESMRGLEDWDLAIRVSKKARLGFVSEALLTSCRVDNSVSLDFANHYQYTSYIIAKHLHDYQKYNLFNTIVEDTYIKAKNYGLEKEVEKMLTLYLSH